MSRVTVFDPVAAAIEIFAETKRLVEEISKKFEEEKNKREFEKKLGGKLRTRAREAPELIEEIGLVPALSFFYSKRDNEEYKLMHWAILRYLKNINVVTTVDNIDSAINSPDIMINLLKELLTKSVVATPLLRPFLVEFKRLCEATWEPLGE
ncbi:MAG: type III-B CRISPR module-associated protein Cmr5 [Thermofilaceae archaeon]